MMNRAISGRMNQNPRLRHRRRRTNNEQPPREKGRPRLPVKRISVQYAHISVSQLLQNRSIRCIQKTHGKGVVRVCSRTVSQLQNTAIILEKLIDENLIDEIGMPLDYAYKMKSLVLFIKPKDTNATEKIEMKFRSSGLNYHLTIFDVKSVQERLEEAKPTENKCQKIIPRKLAITSKKEATQTMPKKSAPIPPVPQKSIVEQYQNTSPMETLGPQLFYKGVLRMTLFSIMLYFLLYSTTLTTLWN